MASKLSSGDLSPNLLRQVECCQPRRNSRFPVRPLNLAMGFARVTELPSRLGCGPRLLAISSVCVLRSSPFLLTVQLPRPIFGLGRDRAA